MNNTVPGAIIIEGHIQGLSNARSLGEIGVPVYIIDKTNCIARYSKFCRKFFRCPDYIKDEFADFLIELAKAENINGWVLIPSNDHAVFTISKNKKDLEQYYKIISPDYGILENIYDKSRLLSIAKNCNIPIPLTQYFKTPDDSVNAELRFPVLTKGKYGLSFYKTMNKKVFLSENKIELRKNLKLIGEKYPVNNCFTQELIPSDGTNKTISFTAFCSNGELKTCWMGIKLREHPIEFGTGTFAESTYIEECAKNSRILLKALNYTGVCEVEYILDPRDKQYKLIEINARTWLWVGLAKACGIDYAKMIYAYVNDQPFNYPAEYKKGIKWRNPFTDIFFTTISILKGKIKLKTVLEQNNGVIIDALYYKRDNKPYWAYLYMLVSFFIRR